MTVKMIGTGGTIAGVLKNGADGAPHEYISGVRKMREMIAADGPLYGALRAIAPGFTLDDIEDVFTVPGEDLTFAYRATLSKSVADYMQDDAVKGVIITHGTDSLDLTARFLYELFPDPVKPIILTGAVRTSDTPGSDARQNIIDSVYAAHHDFTKPFVGVVFGGRIFHARDVRKRDARSLLAFETPGVALAGAVIRPALSEAEPFTLPTEIVEAAFSDNPEAKDHPPCRTPLLSFEELTRESEPKVALIDTRSDFAVKYLAETVEIADAVILNGVGDGNIPLRLRKALQIRRNKITPVIRSAECAGEGKRNAQFNDDELATVRSGALRAGQCMITTKLLLCMSKARGVPLDQMLLQSLLNDRRPLKRFSDACAQGEVTGFTFY